MTQQYNAITKLEKVIDSCKTPQHVACADTAISIFTMRFPDASKAALLLANRLQLKRVNIDCDLILNG